MGGEREHHRSRDGFGCGGGDDLGVWTKTGKITLMWISFIAIR
jgi:hypothetical protein